MSEIQVMYGKTEGVEGRETYGSVDAHAVHGERGRADGLKHRKQNCMRVRIKCIQLQNRRRKVAYRRWPRVDCVPQQATKSLLKHPTSFSLLSFEDLHLSQ